FGLGSDNRERGEGSSEQPRTRQHSARLLQWSLASLVDKLRDRRTPIDVDRRAWRALFAAQLGWMLDAMDFLLFTFAIIPIQEEFLAKSSTMGLLTSVALFAAAIGGIAFGTIADRVGRVRAMTISILFYSLATAGLAT